MIATSSEISQPLRSVGVMYFDKSSMRLARAKLHDEKSDLYDTKNALSAEISRLFEQLKGTTGGPAQTQQERQETKSRIDELRERRNHIGERIQAIKNELAQIKMNLGPPGGGIYTPRRHF